MPEEKKFERRRARRYKMLKWYGDKAEADRIAAEKQGRHVREHDIAGAKRFFVFEVREEK